MNKSSNQNRFIKWVVYRLLVEHIWQKRQRIFLYPNLDIYLPLVVKPCENGSSIGVYICHTEEEYNNAVRESFEKNPDEELVIEPYIKGREFASAVIAGKALPLVEIIPKDGVFNYENKYQAGGAQEICPPVSIDEETQQRMMRAGEEAFAALRMDV